jgi:hypothetical protein
MRKVVRLTETDLRNIVSKILKEQNENKLSNRVYNTIKNFPLVRKIEKSYDPDLKKHILNLVGITPKLKGRESELISKASSNKLGLEDLADKLNTEINKLKSSSLNEQTPSLIHIVTPIILVFLILFIRQIMYDKKNPEERDKKKSEKPPLGSPKELSEIDKKLEVFENKTVNLYNDPQEQILYGKEIISSISFFDNSQLGGRSGVKFGLGFQFQELTPNSRLAQKIFGLYEIICLSNPVRLADYIVREGEYTTNLKYNKKFTDAVGAIAGQYCKSPAADFSVLQKQSNNKIA